MHIATTFAGFALPLLAALALGAPGSPGATPEARQDLEAYYTAAEEVLLAHLLREERVGGELWLTMAVAEIPWKAAQGRPTRPRIGDPVRYRVQPSVAGCELPIRTGAVYVVFATAPTPEALPELDPCGGTRIFVETQGADPLDFEDIPGRFLPSQLDALSGMEVIREFVDAHPDPADPTNATLIGLLDLAAFAHGGTVRVWERPEVGSALLATLASYEEVEAREVGYEVGAAVGFARVDSWTRVRLATGAFGWVAPEEGGTWFPYDEVVVQRLNYLTSSWSGHIWPDPGAGIPARSSDRWSQEAEGVSLEFAAEVLESMELGGTLWFRVHLLAVNPCETGELRNSLTGWIPAYGPTGEPAAWYYSRGC